MIIRVILLSLFAAIAYFVFLRRNRLPVHIMIVFLTLGVAALAVLFPQQTDPIANFVGVGRGADLIVYLVVLALCFAVLHYYTKFVEVQSQITQLVREMALLRAEQGGAPMRAGAAAAASTRAEATEAAVRSGLATQDRVVAAAQQQRATTSPRGVLPE